MRTVTVTDPSGVPWQVRVRWRPRHRAMYRRFGGWRRRRGDERDRVGPGDALDAADVLGQVGGSSGGGGGGGFSPGDLLDDALVGLLIIAGLILFGALFWWLLLPLLLFLLDAVLLILLSALGVGARVLLRRPWSVDATCAASQHELSVVGWRRALRARDGIAAAMATQGAAAWPALVARQWDADDAGSA